jgi:K+/H+ antiporter YhaU regulatory subunit KhtT
MTAIYSLLVILALSFLITRTATAALTLTGISEDLAKLQSISAFTGVGFTTQESERIVQHPVRRRIAMTLMILGNAGIVTAVSSLVVSAIKVQETDDWLTPLAWLAGGIAVLWFIAQSQWLERQMSRAMRWALSKWTRLETHDYASLLQLTGDYSVRLCEVREDDWLADKRLDQMRLLQEGVTVLGIRRPNGNYVGVPRGETLIRTGDQLVLYGPEQTLDELDERRRGATGDVAHDEAVAETQRRRHDEQRRDEEEGSG